VFREFGDNLQIEEPSRSEGPLTSSDLTGLDRWQIEQGAQVLLLLEHISVYQDILESPYNVWESLVIGSPFVRHLWKSLEGLYQGSINSEEDRSAAALKLSDKIFENTSTPIVTSASMTFKEYISQIAPRWEAIGILFARIGVICSFIPEDDAVFRPEGCPIQEKRVFSALAVKLSALCLQFCDKLGIVNDPLCWLTLQHTLLVSQAYGKGGQCHLIHPN
jgi:chromatin structure-remodeling complex subunit RSC3/30